MRIQRLGLERFGHFTDYEFDFGKGGDRPDFHIIYGPNEAGKTTTMEAALRLFYGFPLREGYAFKHQRSNLQVSATLDIDGAVRRFTRLPKRSGSLVDEAGTALPEAALSAHLAGLSEDDYRQLLCLDDDTIERGGEEIANAQGDIGRLLFSAAAGVADLSGVLDGVRDQAVGIWKKGGRSTRIAELKHALVAVEKEIREKDVSASAWKKLKQALAQAQEDERKARKNRDGLNATKAQIAGQQRALPLMIEITTLKKSTAANSEYPERLDFDPERLIELRTDHGTASQNVERLSVTDHTTGQGCRSSLGG